MAHPYEVAAMFPPCAVDKLTLTGRTFTQRFTLDDLIPVGTLTAPLADLLRAAVDAHHNILISGGTGTGNTTLLNAVAQTIPPQDRIVLIEETSEILVDKPNLGRLEARRVQVPLGQEEGRHSAIALIESSSGRSVVRRRSTSCRRPTPAISGA
jgi:Flp pilus assembly CpaF family ATPase